MKKDNMPIIMTENTLNEIRKKVKINIQENKKKDNRINSGKILERL